MSLASSSAFAIFMVFSMVTCHDVISLDGTWKFGDSTKTYADLDGNVPGGIYSDLMENEILEDVFFGYRDLETRWVSKFNWSYYRTFDVDETITSYQNIKLVFDGLDTFAEIYLNNQLIGTTDNMFVQYIFKINQHLQLGSNLLTVKFLSPIHMSQYLFDQQLQDYLVPPTCVPDEYQGECHVNHIRKMQASFSWDWGPAFPSVGIWKSVNIEAYNSTKIRDVTVSITDNESDDWNVEVSTYFDGVKKRKMSGYLIVNLRTDIDIVESIYDINFDNIGNGELVHIGTLTIPKIHVRLWYPNGYGNPQLYPMTITYKSSSGETDSKSIKIGFRTVTLVQDRIEGNAKSEDGLSFYFIVNNIPIFAKGSNSIPLHVLPEKGYNSTVIKFILKSAKAAHMNMIRVWGGGVYESDEFYTLADELGIMIWQDFMFACAMYPVNEEFLSSVKKEVRHQVRRLQYHPSIILWAANNENEAALRQNWYNTAANFDLYKSDFVKLYVETIKPVVLQYDKSRQFLTSSPTNGIRSEEEGYIASNPASNLYGDVHFYNYITDSWEQDGHPTPRFSSEYGLQSFPSLSSLLTATNNISDLQFGSDFLNHRQHHPGGNQEMYLLMGMRLPIVAIDNPNFYKAYIFYSQIHQAMGIKLQTEKYRIWRSGLNSAGEGFTMGALYWQLNDIGDWIAPTWSGIDSHLNWKMLHYFAKKFFSPILITAYQTSARRVTLHAVSDATTNYYNATTTVSIYKWDSFEPINVEKHTNNIMSGFSTKIASVWIDSALSEANCGEVSSSRFDCFVHLSLKDDSGVALAPDNFLFPAPLKDSSVPWSLVKVLYVTQVDTEGLEFDVQLQSDGIALFVWLEASGASGIFSDNGFLMVTKTIVIKFYPNNPISLNDLKARITVTHLMDQQYF